MNLKIFFNNIKKKRTLFILSAAIGILLCRISIQFLLATPESDLKELLKKAIESPNPEIPSAYMYSRGEIIYCTGEDEAGKVNNKAANLMEKGDYIAASELLEEALPHSPIFFPFRYNLGVCSIFLERFDVAELHLEKAINVFPEYYKSYVRLGYVFELKQKADTALVFYRKALNINPRAVEVYVIIGDVFFNRNQLEMAEKYYNASNKIARNTNALLGMAKIHYKRKEYVRSIVIMKTVTFDPEYDKSLHYYYAECAYKLQDYKTALDQYNMLLRYKNDKFFITTSVSLINHKIDLCKRFTEEK